LEDIAVGAFFVSSFGMFVMGLFHGLFTAPSWQSFSLLASGWALASEKHTITTYLWLTGATRVKHFSSFYVFLGGPLYKVRWKLWSRLIDGAAKWIPQGEPIVLACDDSTKKKAGRKIAGVAPYRNSAGTARQEYRTLWGLNFVWVIMRIPLSCWPGHRLSVPVGLSLYLKEPQAKRLKLAYRSRSALAREIIDFVADQLPGRTIRVLADGGYATKDFLRDLPKNVDVVSRLLTTGKLYALPTPPRPGTRGRRPSKGKLIGSPQTLARKRLGWQAHPTAAGVKVQAWQGLWHAVLPGRQLRLVVLRRPTTKRSKQASQRKPPPQIEAFFTTDLSLTPEDILNQYRERWTVEITIRDSYGFDGLGHDQCRKVERIIGANTLRLVMAAARTLWFVAQAEQRHGIELRRYRPWYRHKVAPSQRDIIWACREALQEDGICPIPWFRPDLAQNYQEPENILPIAA
jgi:DDE superfamily endonuclease